MYISVAVRAYTSHSPFFIKIYRNLLEHNRIICQTLSREKLFGLPAWWYTLIMASTAAFPTPITFQNKKQLRAQCRYKNIAYTAETTQAQLVTLLNA